MLKLEEVTDPYSCFNKGAPDEYMFVLLARDEAAPAAIRAWVQERVKLKLNTPTDKKIQEALECAAKMEEQRAKRKGT